MALQGNTVRQEGDQHLQQSDGRGNGCQDDQQIEQHTKQGAGGTHGVEHVLKGDEQQGGARLGGVGAAKGKGGGQNGHTGHNRHNGVRDNDNQGVFTRLSFLLR